MTTRNNTRASRSATVKTKPLKPHRTLKVRQTYYAYQLNQGYRPKTEVGEIHLKGNWLIEAGVAIDTPVNIRVMEGCLVLTVEVPT